MPDPPDPSVKPPIFNAVLAYMKFLMLSRDRAYLQEAIIARFSLDDLINAHKVISSHCEPDHAKDNFISQMKIPGSIQVHQSLNQRNSTMSFLMKIGKA